MQYAVNLADMTVRQFAMIGQILVGPVMGATESIGDRFDDVVVVLNCEEERARAIIDVIRVRANKNQVRCYSRTNKAWRRV